MCRLCAIKWTPERGVLSTVVFSGAVVSIPTERDGQALVRLDPSQRGVERQFADGDAHAASAKVTQPQDTLAVSHHDRAHVRLRPADGLRSPTSFTSQWFC